MTGFRWFSKIFAYPCALDESSLSIGRVKGLIQILDMILLVLPGLMGTRVFCRVGNRLQFHDR